MKIKYAVVVLCLMVCGKASSQTASGSIRNGIDDTLGLQRPLVGTIQRASGTNSVGYGKRSYFAKGFTVGEDGIIISSLCSVDSPARDASQMNAMAGLVNAPVMTDRQSSPESWHVVPDSERLNLGEGLQWFDSVSSSFCCWLGSATMTNESTCRELGHRIVIHSAGKFPVSNYWCEVSHNYDLASSSAPLQIVSRFCIATNTEDGTEIPFNRNFVGIDFGTNGVCDSYFDPTFGIWVAGKDDTVYANGELPSEVKYNWWYRFGASFIESAETAEDLVQLRSRFALGSKRFRTDIYDRNGQRLTSKVLYEARPIVRIANSSRGQSLVVTLGQLNVPYVMECRKAVDDPVWQPFMAGNVLYSGGGSITIPGQTEPQMLFRVRQLRE